MASIALVERRPPVDEYRRLIAVVGRTPRDPEPIARGAGWKAQRPTGPAMYRGLNRSP